MLPAMSPRLTWILFPIGLGFGLAGLCTCHSPGPASAPTPPSSSQAPPLAKGGEEPAPTLPSPPPGGEGVSLRWPEPADEHNIFGYPRAGVLLRRAGYTLGHHGGYRLPLWVSYHLTREYVDGKEFAPRANLHWKSDPDLLPDARAEDSDYRGSGYARGHMAAQADMRGRSEECERQAYVLSNVCPQRQTLNAGVWLDLENACRGWAKRYGEVWILCGPVVDPDPGRLRRLQGETPDRVAIPIGFYKIIVRRAAADEGQQDGLAVLAFLYRHEPVPSKDSPLDDFVASVDQVEERTGLDFLAELPDEVEERVEAEVASLTWPR